MKNKIYLLILLLVIGGTLSPRLPAQTRIKISKRYANQMNLAVPLFESRGVEGRELAPDLTNLLLDDLFLSGFFSPVSEKTFIQEAEAADRKSGKINLQEWASLGTEVLVKGNYLLSGDTITIECRTISVAQGQQVYGKKYKSSRDRWQEIIHSLADEIVQALTGERGLARTEIAFVSSDRGGKKVYVMDASGHNWRMINSGPGFALNPDWSPDGRYLVYTSYCSSFPWVFLDDLSTGKRRVIAAQPGLNAFPAVSPDGRKIALTLSKDGNNEIYTMNLEGKELKRLTNNPANDCSPSWSPDGQEIAFTSDRRGSPQIYIMDSSGKHWRRLTVEGPYNTSPAWSPGGDSIAYASEIDRNFEICLIAVKTGEVRRLTRNWVNDEDPSWAPDGRHLVYTSRQGGRTNLSVLDTYNPEPIPITSGKDCFSPAWGPYPLK